MGLLPMLVIVVGLISGLLAPRLYGQSRSASGERTLDSRRQAVLSEFGSCVRSLPEKVETTFISPCAQRDATLLVGISRATLASGLGHPDWCKPGPNAQLLPWSDRACAGSPIWGYSFYRVPAVGGGPELQFTFDGSQTSPQCGGCTPNDWGTAASRGGRPGVAAGAPIDRAMVPLIDSLVSTKSLV